MKYIFFLPVLVFVLAGCTSEIVHLGCQEGEIDHKGECVVAEESNVILFGQDLDKYVSSEDVEGGFFAQPKEAGNYPGVLMIHEWWGLNENIKEMAKLLAKEGYLVYAVDLYSGEVASESGKARELSTSVRLNPDAAIADMKVGILYLRGKGAKSVGSLGWCFGGQQSLQISLNEKLDATVIYYGSLIDDKDQLGNINWPVLGIFGEEDTSISVESVKGFEKSLDELGISNDIYIYPNVGHAFANPSGSRYAAQETLDAWSRTVRFLDASLK